MSTQRPRDRVIIDARSSQIVSGIPENIPEVGGARDRPRRNPRFDPAQHGSLTSEDYFVLTRIDGSASLRDVILETGLPVDRAVEILQRLRAVGALLIGEEEPFEPAERGAPREPPHAVGTLPRQAPRDRSGRARADGAEGGPASSELELTSVERAAMAEQVPLDDGEKLEIIRLLRVVADGTLFDLLGVDRDTSGRSLKRAYFKISKRFHPDRYYGKDLGTFGPWLSQVFERANAAFDILSDDRKRAEYMARLDGRPGAGQLRRFQTQQEHAEELFERACQLELRRELVGALELFAAVARVDPRASYLRRAARCALAAAQLSLAEEYAKKAAGLQPDDPSSARLLASIYRAAGKLALAKETLERALAVPLDNDALVTELQSDLETVRDELGEGG